MSKIIEQTDRFIIQQESDGYVLVDKRHRTYPGPESKIGLVGGEALRLEAELSRPLRPSESLDKKLAAFLKKRTSRLDTVMDSTILQGMARGPYASWWSTNMEDQGRSFSGQDIMEAAPNTPRWAHAWAKKLGKSISSLNRATLSNLYASAQDVGYYGTAETFGVHLGMETVGSGIAWTDDLKGATSLKILVPSYEMWGPGCEKSEPDTRFVRR